MVSSKNTPYIVFALIYLLLLSSCSPYRLFSKNNNAKSLFEASAHLKKKPTLDLFLLNGEIINMSDTWDVDTSNQLVIGNGIIYNRKDIERYRGEISTSFDSINYYKAYEYNKSNAQRDTFITVLGIVVGFAGLLMYRFIYLLDKNIN